VIFSIILDVLVAVLLAVTIAYAMVLNRRLGGLRRDKTQLELMAGNFTEATLRADESVGRLKDVGDSLRRNVEKAQALHDDLTFLIDRGEIAADRLEDIVRVARKEGGLTGRPEKTAGPIAEEAPEIKDEAGRMEPQAPARSEAERELLKALQAAR
jgi:hypothetical protein